MVKTVSRSYLFERVDVDLFGAVYSVYSSSLFIQPFSPLRLPLLRDVSSRSLRLLRKYQQLPTKKDRERKKKIRYNLRGLRVVPSKANKCKLFTEEGYIALIKRQKGFAIIYESTKHQLNLFHNV